jgi:hypothetical protein
LLLILVAEAVVWGGAHWVSGLPHVWPVVIATVYLAYCGLGLIASASVAGLACGVLSLASPGRDMIAKALAILAILGHATALAIVAWPIIFGRR